MKLFLAGQFDFEYAFDMAARLRALSFDDGSGKHDRR